MDNKKSKQKTHKNTKSLPLLEAIHPLSSAAYSTEDSLGGVASTGDMTGLQPTPPRTEAEVESYSSLGPLPVPDSVLRENEKRKG